MRICRPAKREIILKSVAIPAFITTADKKKEPLTSGLAAEM